MEQQYQTDLFSFSTPKFHLGNKPVRLIELFAGIGSQYLALKRLGVNVEAWRVVEFDQHAIDSYNAIHGTNFPTMDVTEIHAQDLGIAEREIYLHPYIFLSVPGLVYRRVTKRNGQG